MPVNPINSGGDGIALLVAYGLIAEVIAKACSSPQTAELNAEKRAPTLMKWVNIGTTEGIAVVLLAAYVDKKHRSAILAGGILGATVTYGQYVYAKRCGLSNPGEPTEDW
jgi:hypothetical protein